MGYRELTIEGRNAVLEAFRSGQTIDRLYVIKDNESGALNSIIREAKKQNTIIEFVSKQRLDRISETGKHQGVVAYAAAYSYAGIDDMLAAAEEKKEDPFLILLDHVEDPHNLGAVIRTANLAGAHGVIIPERRAAGLTASAVRASAGAVSYTPVAKVSNLAAAIEKLKSRGIWFACADMDGRPMSETPLSGPICLVLGSEGGVSRLVKEKCDFSVSIPMYGQIDSFNVSVAAGILAYEIIRQRKSV